MISREKTEEEIRDLIIADSRLIGYDSIQRAKNALKRRKRADRKDYPENHHRYRILEGGSGSCVYEEEET